MGKPTPDTIGIGIGKVTFHNWTPQRMAIHKYIYRKKHVGYFDHRFWAMFSTQMAQE
jgi:hypothetical protein